jgi:two-component system cell cycle sensor histidine kinase/response regulator CckA
MKTHPKEHTKQVKALKQQIQNLNLLSRRIIFSIPLSLLVLDKNLKIITANRTYRQTINKTKEEIVGRKASEVFPKALLAEYNLLKNMKKTLSSGKTLRLTDIKHEIPHHPTKYLHITLTIIRQTEENQLLVIIDDITEHKNLELQLQQAQKMETVETLAGGIAHNFNNLLMGIQGYVSLMLIKMDEKHLFYKKLRRIEDRIQKGADLTQKLLGFAQGGGYNPTPADLNDLILKSVNIFGSVGTGIRIHTNLQKDLPTVLIDQRQIEEVLLNIYINAGHSMPNGGDLRLETSTIFVDQTGHTPYSLKNGEYVKISVTDTGLGMDHKTQERIFEPFFTTREIGKGTGLGLAVAYGIIKNHKGKVTVSSEIGRGTTFHIYLPVTKKAKPRESKISDDIIKGFGTILLVDDEETVLDLVKEVLETLGYSVLVARDGGQAVNKYRKNKEKISLVILDMVMPKMGGREAFEQIKTINPGVKVLLASGFSISSEAQELLKQGANGFIQKPHGIKAFSQKIAEIIKG